MNPIHNIATGAWNKEYLRDVQSGGQAGLPAPRQAGTVRPPSRESLERNIAQYREYVQNSGLGEKELAELEREYVGAYGLLAFVKLFDWFSLTSEYHK